MNNHLSDRNEEELSPAHRALVDKDNELEHRLFSRDQRPTVEEITHFLDELHDRVKSTDVDLEFETAVTLFNKWKIKLLAFYDYDDYEKMISRPFCELYVRALFPYYKDVFTPQIEHDLEKYRQRLRTRYVRMDEPIKSVVINESAEAELFPKYAIAKKSNPQIQDDLDKWRRRMMLKPGE